MLKLKIFVGILQKYLLVFYKKYAILCTERSGKEKVPLLLFLGGEV